MCLVRTVPSAGELPEGDVLVKQSSQDEKKTRLIILHSSHHCKSRGRKDEPKPHAWHTVNRRDSVSPVGRRLHATGYRTNQSNTFVLKLPLRSFLSIRISK